MAPKFNGRDEPLSVASLCEQVKEFAAEEGERSPFTILDKVRCLPSATRLYRTII